MSDGTYVVLQILIWFACAAGSAVAIALMFAAGFAAFYFLGLLQAILRSEPERKS